MPGGRPKGSENKTPARVKAAFAAFVEGNLPKMQERMDRIEDDKDWFDCLAKMASFCVPKPTEISGPDGEHLQIVINRVRVAPPEKAD